MKRIAAIFIVLAMASGIATAQAGNVPRACSSGGVSYLLGQTEARYWEWALGANDAQQVGRLYFVPVPNGAPNDGTATPDDPVIYVGSADVTVKTGFTLVLPISVYIGEVLHARFAHAGRRSRQSAARLFHGTNRARDSRRPCGG